MRVIFVFISQSNKSDKVLIIRKLPGSKRARSVSRSASRSTTDLDEESQLIIGQRLVSKRLGRGGCVPLDADTLLAVMHLVSLCPRLRARIGATW